MKTQFISSILYRVVCNKCGARVAYCPDQKIARELSQLPDTICERCKSTEKVANKMRRRQFQAAQMALLRR